MKDLDAVRLYREYQSSRTPGMEEVIAPVLELARSRRSAGKGETAERYLPELFRDHFPHTADPEREGSIAIIMEAAKRRSRTGSPVPGSPSRDPGTGIVARVRYAARAVVEKLAGDGPAPGWRMAAPAMALAVVVTILLSLPDDRSRVQIHDAWGVPSVVVTYAPQLAPSIGPARPMAGFGFSGTVDGPSAAFQLGVMATDLYVLEASGNRQEASAILTGILQLAPQTGVDASLLVAAGSQQEPPMAQGTVSEQTKAIVHALEQQLDKQGWITMFRFGMWLEATLLAVDRLHEGADSQPLKLLLELWRESGKELTPSVSPPIAGLISDLDRLATPADPLSVETGKLRQRLLQIRSALQ